MKKYVIAGVIILVAGVLINYKLGGFEKTAPRLIGVNDYFIYGTSFEGSYKSNVLSSLVDEMRNRQKQMDSTANVVIINYVNEAKETLGIVSNFVGITTNLKPDDRFKELEKRVIKAKKAIRVKVKIKPLVMPSPEKIKALAFELATKEGLVLQDLSIEQYREQGVLVIDFPVKKEMSYLEKLADAYGYSSFNAAKTYYYTFNVKKGEAGVARSWIWQPGSEEVTLITGGDTISFNRKRLSGNQKKLDHTFINDKYWLLFPFQLLWDTGYTYNLEKNILSPIAKEATTKLTITYNAEGGYTPGDAYDFYINEDFEIKEWSFRKGSQKEPSLTTTWEDYRTFDGIKISTNHLTENGSFRLWFTGIKIE